MTEHGIRKIKTCYKLAMSALTAVVGLLFILQVWAIFFSAEKSPFTYAIIGEKLLELLVPALLWVQGVIGGGVLWRLYPDEKEKLRGELSPRVTLHRLKARLPKDEGGMYELKRIKALSIVVWSVVAFACLAASVAVLSILFDGAYEPMFKGEFFTAHDGAADRLLRCAVYVVACALTCITAVFVDEQLVEKETRLVKAQLAENAKKGVKPVKTGKKATMYESILEKYPVFKSKWWKQGLQIGLCAVGLALFVIGIVNGGMSDVFEKARNICTQCIGLG